MSHQKVDHGSPQLLSLIALSNVYLFMIPPQPCSKSHLYKLIQTLISSVTLSFNIFCKWIKLFKIRNSWFIQIDFSSQCRDSRLRVFLFTETCSIILPDRTPPPYAYLVTAIHKISFSLSEQMWIVMIAVMTRKKLMTNPI